jgi:hypothetical protein
MKILLFLIFSLSLFSQTENQKNDSLKIKKESKYLDRSLHLSISPYALLYSGVKFNFEYKNPASQLSYRISTAFYNGNISDEGIFYRMNNPSRGDVNGGGIDLAIQYYINENWMKDFYAVFIGFQGGYKYSEISAKKNYLIPELEDGVEVLSSQSLESGIFINQYHFSFIIGANLVASSYFSIGGNFQYGLNFSDVHESRRPINDFNDNFFAKNGNDYAIDLYIGVWLKNIFK